MRKTNVSFGLQKARAPRLVRKEERKEEEEEEEEGEGEEIQDQGMMLS